MPLNSTELAAIKNRFEVAAADWPGVDVLGKVAGDVRALLVDAENRNALEAHNARLRRIVARLLEGAKYSEAVRKELREALDAATPGV